MPSVMRLEFVGAVQPEMHGVARLNPTGTAILYSTYIGLPGEDESYAIAVDAEGNAYMAGYLSLNGEPPL